MRSARRLATLAGVGLPIAIATSAQAAPQLRHQVDQSGDFVLFGNTLAYECNSQNLAVPDPMVGTADCSGTENGSVNDSAPDIYWRSDAPDDGNAQANADITAEQARSTAVLLLPEGAVITYARMYWAGYLDANQADETARVERVGSDLDEEVTADDSWTVQDQGNGTWWYQSTADVTEIVAAAGAGAFRVGGVSTLELPNLTDDHPIAAWSMVVFYTLEGDTPRNLALFDGLDFVNGTENPEVTIAGFVVPNAGYDAKLGVVTYEGDARYNGDGLTFNDEPLSDPPIREEDNFFNASRTHLGDAVSVAGDLPQLTGGENSMAGMDMAVIDVESLLDAGDTSATISAVSTQETYLLGVFVTSISTFKPDFSSSGKTLRDINGGAIAPGDELEYTVTGVNTGNDRSVGTVLTDELPEGITFVPDSIEITEGPNAGALTDETGDDQAEYDEGSRTVTVRLGTDADESQGGVIAVDESTAVTFRVTVDSGASGTISNQAIISASGEQGATESDFPTDGNAENPGTPPTEGVVGEGASDDSDGDGLTDAEEAALGSSPDDADSDDDGVPDDDEKNPSQDADDDGINNILDSDADGDGLFDGTELGLDCAGGGTDTSANTCVADGDDGTTKTDPLVADTDKGGVSDGEEDTNRNGVVDTGERDPNEASDDTAEAGRGGAGGAAGAAGAAPVGAQGGSAGAAPATGGTAPSTAGTAGAAPATGGTTTTSAAGAPPATGGSAKQKEEDTGADVPEGVLEGGGFSCSMPRRGSRGLGALALLAASIGLLGLRRRVR